MKKNLILLCSFLAVMAFSCQNAGKTNKSNEIQTLSENLLPSEASVKERVEQMLEMDFVNDVDKILTKEMLEKQEHAQGVFYAVEYFTGFSWNTGLIDQCSPDASASITGVKVLDATHSDVEMHWVDDSCYDLPYTLHLLLEDGQWKIDDVYYPNGGEGNESHTLRDDCDAFYDMVSELYANGPVDEIMEYLLGEEPAEEDYTHPLTIFYNNPQAVKSHVTQLSNNHELFKKNPGYTAEMGQQIEAMIARMESHL